MHDEDVADEADDGLNKWVFPKIMGKPLKSSHLFIGVSIIFTTHFGGKVFQPPLFLVQHPNFSPSESFNESSGNQKPNLAIPKGTETPPQGWTSWTTRKRPVSLGAQRYAKKKPKKTFGWLENMCIVLHLCIVCSE